MATALTDHILPRSICIYYLKCVHPRGPQDIKEKGGRSHCRLKIFRYIRSMYTEIRYKIHVLDGAVDRS